MVDTEDLKREVDILALIGKDTELRRVANTNGGEHAGACPWCEGRDRFRVWPEQGRYWCRQCGRKGDAIQYLRDFRGLTFPEACKWLGGTRTALAERKRRRIETLEATARPAPPPPSWQEKAGRVVSSCESVLWGEGGVKARRYLHERRGLKEETIRKCRLGYNPRVRELFGLWVFLGITIPCFVGDELWYVKVRTWSNASGEKYRHIKDGKGALFGLGNIQDHHVAFICEGEFDALLLDQEAGDLAGAVALGGVRNELRSWLSHLLGLRSVFLALDLDDSGRKRARELLVTSKRMKPVFLPSLGGRVVDLTDYWREGGCLRDWAEYHLAMDGFRRYGLTQEETVL